MGLMNIDNATYSNMTNVVENVVIDNIDTDGVTGQFETTWTIQDWTKYWGYFNAIPDLQSAFLMKSIWNCGKGYTADPETSVILDHITGWGKDTFNDVLFNMDVVRNIAGDSFAEIIRDDDTGILINLKPLDPSSIRIVVDEYGIIKRYEQISKMKDKGVKKFKPNQIFHLSCNRLADQIHGISRIKAMENTILAENESFVDLKKLMHHQVKPFILWKLKTDDNATIAKLVAKIDAARNLGEDMFIPDDDNAVSYEIVQLNVTDAVFNWRNDIKNKFYRSLGIPLVLFGQAGSTESGGKIEYLGHEQIWEYEQRYLEQQIWAQLFLRIDLYPPQSLLNNLQTDQAKDAGQGMEMQKQDMTAGAG